MEKKVRVNFLCTFTEKQRMQDLAVLNKQSLTDFIIDRALSGSSKEYQELKQQYEKLKTKNENWSEQKAEMIEDHYHALTELTEQHKAAVEHTRQVYAQMITDERQDWIQDKQEFKEQYKDLQEQYRELQKQHDLTYQALIWHSLPFYKKIGKRLELPNKK